MANYRKKNSKKKDPTDAVNHLKIVLDACYLRLTLNDTQIDGKMTKGLMAHSTQTSNRSQRYSSRQGSQPYTSAQPTLKQRPRPAQPAVSGDSTLRKLQMQVAVHCPAIRGTVEAADLILPSRKHLFCPTISKQTIVYI